MKVNLGNIGLGVLLTFGASMLAILIISISSKHDVEYYYLSTNIDGKLSIKANIDWSGDKDLKLDRAVSYSEAIDMVERLNKTLK